MVTIYHDTRNLSLVAMQSLYVRGYDLDLTSMAVAHRSRGAVQKTKVVIINCSFVVIMSHRGVTAASCGNSFDLADESRNMIQKTEVYMPGLGA
jgi:hypothetical protein